MSLATGPEGKPWILVIDDDPGTREALVDILERAGYGVTSLEGGDLSAAPGGRPFLVAVVDYHLPEASGLEVARRLKALQPDCRIVLISSEPPPDPTPEVDRFLAKPFSKEAILEVIAKLCPQPAP
jgi:CheY-like chemotaxis protein